MPRVVDKNTRIIDVDFGTVSASFNRTAGLFNPDVITFDYNGADQIISQVAAGAVAGGSFVQYQRIDLSFMLEQGEIMMPVNVNSQRTSPVPLGFQNNGNTYDQVEEYIYIFTKPLNNAGIASMTTGIEYEDFRNLGLDNSLAVVTPSVILGDFGSVPSLEQTVYAEKRIYGTNTNLIATRTNGMLDPGQPDYNTVEGMLALQSVTTWGSMNTITGPNLHCYRIVIDRGQSLLPINNIFVNEQFPGASNRKWPPVNVSFLCKDPNYSEGEYLTRLANAMNKTPEGGWTNDP